MPPRPRLRLRLVSTWIALGLLAATACGGPGARGPGEGSPTVVVVNRVSIAFTADPDRLPFDPRAARLLAATQQLTALAGHAVTFQFDVALLPQWRSSFESALIEAIENVARDLDAMKRLQPELFAFADPALERVECRYVAVPTDDDLVFDPAGHALRIALASEARAFVSEGWLLRATAGAYFDFLDKRYRNADPDHIDDPALYFRYLASSRRAQPDAEARARTISLVARLYPRLQATPRADAQRWLGEHVEFFSDAYRDGAPKSLTFRAAEAAWVAWLNADVDRLPDKLRDQVVRHLAVERRDRRPGETYYRTDTFPGFDLLGYGLRVFDEWAAAGHPMRAEDHPQGFLTFIYFVCPAPRDHDGGHTRAFACDHTLYRLAADNDANLRRLTAYLLARDDPFRVDTAMANLVGLRDAYPTMLAVWRSLEAKPAAWEVATRMVAEKVHVLSQGSALQDEAQRLWRALPAERGAVLYLLSQIEDDHYGTIAWKAFAHTFGDLASARDFETFLDQNDRAFWNAHEVWDALSPGWSRAAVLTTRLDDYLDGQAAAGATPQAVDALGRIVGRMCDARADADLTALHAWVQKRTASHASEQRDLEPIAFRTAPGKCAALDTSAASATKPRGPAIPTPIGNE